MADGSYPLSRPLYIYSDVATLRQEPEVAAFVNYYLHYVGDVLIDAGYFPTKTDVLNQSRRVFVTITS
ncbi:MAG: hypothetical protein HC828_18090 [Blastochloris sp.]|nr:hypothetical protein [Blastochloris sp.]